jgi:hypothetical protein
MALRLLNPQSKKWLQDNERGEQVTAVMTRTFNNSISSNCIENYFWSPVPLRILSTGMVSSSLFLAVQPETGSI